MPVNASFLGLCVEVAIEYVSDLWLEAVGWTMVVGEEPALYTAFCVKRLVVFDLVWEEMTR